MPSRPTPGAATDNGQPRDGEAECSSLEAERLKQLATEERRYTNLCAVMREAGAEQADWSYSPPRSDDWTEWCPVARYCAADLRYRQTGETYGLLATGHGPYYCPACEKRPGAGWIARLCLECWWWDAGYDQALSAARQLGRRWSEQTRRVA